VSQPAAQGGKVEKTSKRRQQQPGEQLAAAAEAQDVKPTASEQRPAAVQLVAGELREARSQFVPAACCMQPSRQQIT